jgi:hypothetical protein
MSIDPRLVFPLIAWLAALPILAMGCVWLWITPSPAAAEQYLPLRGKWRRALAALFLLAVGVLSTPAVLLLWAIVV